METSPLICRANQWTGFFMTTASVMKELIFQKWLGTRTVLGSTLQ